MVGSFLDSSQYRSAINLTYIIFFENAKQIREIESEQEYLSLFPHSNQAARKEK